MAPDKLSFRQLLAAVGIIAALLYARTLSFQFVWDDSVFVVRNPSVQSWQRIGSWFSTGTAYATEGVDAPMFRPVRNFSYLIDFTVAGLNPLVYHLQNVVLHTITTLLLASVLWKILRFVGHREADDPPADPGWPCLLATLWWSAHPVHTEVVAWVKSRDEMLFAAFGLAACLALGHDRWSARLRWSAFIALTALALLSKEMAVTLGPVLAVVGLVALQSDEGRRRWIGGAVVAVLLAIGYLAWRHYVLGKTEQTSRPSGSAWYDLLTTLCVVGEYARLACLPLLQRADYHEFPIATSIGEGRVLLGLLVVGLWGAVGLMFWRRGGLRGRVITAAVLMVPITLLPVLNIVPMMQFLAERFLYVPLMGATVPLALLLRRASRTGWILVSGYTLLLLLLGIARQGVWANDVVLFSANYRDGYGSARVAQNYASALSARGRWEEARLVLEPLLKPSSRAVDGALLHQGLAVVNFQLGNSAAATTHCIEALRINPKSVDALLTLGAVKGNSGDHTAALEAFTSASLLAPADPQILGNLELARRATESMRSTPK